MYLLLYRIGDIYYQREKNHLTSRCVHKLLEHYNDSKKPQNMTFSPQNNYRPVRLAFGKLSYCDII